MANAKQQPLPAILFSHFDGSAELIAMAKEFIAVGYPIIASVQAGDQAVRQQAETIGCDVAEHKPCGGLRAGLERFRADWMDKLPGVIVFEPEDGFGVGDVLNVADAFRASGDRLVMASRRRNPKLGLFTNLVRGLAALAFTIVHGRKVGDPWASLRAIPSQYVPAFLDLKGDSCKLLINMLLNLQHMGIKTVSVPVAAAYDYECESRLWDRFVDIFRIVLLPLKFVSASAVTMLTDNGVFFLFGYLLTQNKVMLATVIARASGAIVGYFLNKNIVFKDNKQSGKYDYKPLLKYVALASCNTLIAMNLVPFINREFGIYAFISKQIVDVLLFTSNFLIQRDFIFRKKQ